MTESLDRVSLNVENYVAAVRSQVYGQLAAAFRYPSTPTAVTWVASGAAEQDLQDLLAELGWPALGPIIAGGTPPISHPGTGAGGVDVLHLSLFDSATGRSVVSLCERTYATCSRESLWEELFRCYTHFGLEFDDGGLREAPDLLSIELEFMHYLTYLEASNPKTARGVVLGQADFLARHLAVWTESVNDALEEREPQSVYARFSHLLHGFVTADHAFVSAKADGLRRP